MDFVGEDECRGSAVRRRGVAADDFEVGALFGIGDLLCRVVSVIAARRRDQALVLADDADDINELNDGLHSIGYSVFVLAFEHFL